MAHALRAFRQLDTIAGVVGADALRDGERHEALQRLQPILLAKRFLPSSILLT